MLYQTPARATKASKLIEQLSSIARAHEADDFALRRLEYEAKKLMSVDAVHAHIVLGALASLRGDTKELRYHHNIALQQSGQSAHTHRNYSVSLLHVGETVEAFEVAREAFERAPDDSSALKQYIETALESAHFREACNLCERWSGSFPDLPVPHELSARDLAGAVERGALGETPAREVLKIAHVTRGAANVRMVETAVVVDCTEPDSFLYKLYVSAPQCLAVDLNEKVADRIVARSDLMDNPGLGFVPVFIGTQLDAGHSRSDD